jgi:hypothetical protein
MNKKLIENLPLKVKIIDNHNCHPYKIGSFVFIFDYTGNKNKFGYGYYTELGYVIRDIDFILINNKQLFSGR